GAVCWGVASGIRTSEPVSASPCCLAPAPAPAPPRANSSPRTMATKVSQGPAAFAPPGRASSGFRFTELNSVVPPASVRATTVKPHTTAALADADAADQAERPATYPPMASATRNMPPSHQPRLSATQPWSEPNPSAIQNELSSTSDSRPITRPANTPPQCTESSRSVRLVAVIPSCRVMVLISLPLFPLRRAKRFHSRFYPPLLTASCGVPGCNAAVTQRFHAGRGRVLRS